MIPSLLYQTRRKNPLEHKRLSEAFVIFRINNCVGEANHHVFVLLLFYAMMFGLNTFVFLMLHFWVWPKCQLCDHVSTVLKFSVILLNFDFLCFVLIYSDDFFI